MRASPTLCLRSFRTTMPSPLGRTYADAIDKLNSTQSNAAVIEAIRKSGGKGGEAQVVESLEYLGRIGYKASDLNDLNAIHITGTKGKGSTSAFTDSILRTVAPSAKTGLYTSPHLVAVRERIRINGKPLDEEVFAKYFFEIWDRLEKNTTRATPDTTPEKPAYFRYLTLLAFHVFLQEKVDTTILEVGVGGTYDSTNIVPQPITTGVTSLGIDHVFVLGKTIPEIAHQKGGIYKPGVPALAIEQPAEGLDVLASRAKELGSSSFNVVPELPELKTVQLGLAGDHQRTNASVAVALVQSFLASPRLPPAFTSYALPHPEPAPTLPASLISPSPLTDALLKGLERTKWPGRCQVEPDTVSGSDLTWYLDGAHTVESLTCCGDWFGAVHTSDSTRPRALIFNCTSGRSGLSLLGALLKSLQASANSSTAASPFQHVFFCTNTTYSSGASKSDLISKAVDEKDLENLTVQHELADAWKTLLAAKDDTEGAKVTILGSVEEAVRSVRALGPADVLVTGSLILVGGLMEVAQLPLDL